MDDNDLSTSPRKKHKAHHHMDKTAMTDKPASDVPPATLTQPATGDAGHEKERLDKEVQCGIIEYVSPHLPGFTGILKKRYTDFLVNEILPNGQVVHLDRLQKPLEQEPLSHPASKSSQKQQPGHAAPHRGGVPSAIRVNQPQQSRGAITEEGDCVPTTWCRCSKSREWKRKCASGGACQTRSCGLLGVGRQGS
ncbi:hypothetical protein XPA_000366 [Xanthoria parietina]